MQMKIFIIITIIIVIILLQHVTRNFTLEHMLFFINYFKHILTENFF